jgi:hypothetical protein
MDPAPHALKDLLFCTALVRCCCRRIGFIEKTLRAIDETGLLHLPEPVRKVGYGMNIAHANTSSNLRFP